MYFCTAKNKATKQLHMQSESTNKQAVKQTNNCVPHTSKHCAKYKKNNNEKSQDYFRYFKVKKQAVTPRKKGNTNQT